MRLFPNPIQAMLQPINTIGINLCILSGQLK
jgi:hypothetical protein